MKTQIIYATAKQAFVDGHVDAPVVAITYNEGGYHPIYTGASVESLNGSGVTPEIVESAVHASMFGWDTPAARPAVDYFAAQ